MSRWKELMSVDDKVPSMIKYLLLGDAVILELGPRRSPFRYMDMQVDMNVPKTRYEQHILLPRHHIAAATYSLLTISHL